MIEQRPSAADGAAAAEVVADEMDEVQREFQRSLSLSNNNDNGDSGDNAAPPTVAKDAKVRPSGEDDGGEPRDARQSSTAASDQHADGAKPIPGAPPPGEEADGGDDDARKASSRGSGNYVAPKDFELLKVIGMGAFGKVLQVRNRNSSKVFAMKVISKRLIRRKRSYVENILAERDILFKIANHPFIVTMHASFQTGEKLFIIMDFCAGGELFLKVAREGHFLERTAAFYLAEIVLALEHLHSVNVLHRDLKPENILLGSDGHCCLTDFGLAKDFTDSEDERARTLCGTMEYMAPEMVARKWYGKGADFWSLGCIAYEMLSGLPPFESKKGSKELFRKIMNERIRMPDGASSAACKLLKGLLNRDAGKRLGAARGTMFEMGGVGALKQQPFFLGLDWGKLELKEIDPPEEFGVDNDEDLRHFHEEFVNMTLPRSVKEMSKLDFLPRHCESQNFRGFSFIGDSFPLPERSASEQEHYWNNCDADGQSLSDCASSVFGDDLGEVPTAPAEPVVPEKKKRPPRKKKKKQQLVPPMETTDEGNEGKENAAGDEASDKKVEVDAKAHLEGNNTQTRDLEAPVVAPDDQKPLAQPRDAMESKSTKIFLPHATSVNGTSAKSEDKSLNPNATARKTPTKPAPQASAPRQVVVPHQTTQAQKKNVAAPSYAPKPGSWASMAVAKTKPNNIQNVVARPVQRTVVSAAAPSKGWPPKTQTDRPAAGPPMVLPESPRTPRAADWRTHVVSPRRVLTPKSTARQVPIPPPPIPQPEQNAWPTLGGFPPPPGAKPNASKQSKPSKPMGAWGRSK